MMAVHFRLNPRKIATIDKLTVDERSLINMSVAIIRYQYDNHLGSASLELDATAQIISYEEYHPFGSTSYRSGRSETEVSLKRYKYVGKERDEETGLYYYGARYYAAWIGRFVSVDPMAYERTWVNPYNYVQNNPITRIDSNGMLDGEPDEIPNEKIKVGNITFINQAARSIKSKQSVIQAVEKNIEYLKSNNINNADVVSENNKQLKDLNKELNDLLKSAREIDMMINEIILYSPMVNHLKHSSREEYFPESNVGDKFDVLGAINECLDESKPLTINVSAGEIEDNKSSLGATRVENLGDHYNAYITINLNKTMDSFASFANEIGDVYNKVNNEASEWEAEDIEMREKFQNEHTNIYADSYEKAWDDFYRSLNSTKISFYIQDLFEKARESYKQLNGVK